MERGRLSPLSSTFLNFFDQCESSMLSGLLIGLGLTNYLLLVTSATTLVVQLTRSAIPGMQQGPTVSLTYGQWYSASVLGNSGQSREVRRQPEEEESSSSLSDVLNDFVDKLKKREALNSDLGWDSWRTHCSLWLCHDSLEGSSIVLGIQWSATTSTYIN